MPFNLTIKYVVWTISPKKLSQTLVILLSFAETSIFDKNIWSCLAPHAFYKTCLQDGSGK